MVYRDRRYHGTLFKGYCGITQGDTLSPTITKVVVDAVTQHWATVVAVEEARASGFRRAVQRMA